ncbi:MAG: hypothetical protein ACM3UZ_11910 [Acidobacteriota bacterium]
MGTNLLKMTEDQFWNSTPKKLQALFRVYKTVNGIDDQGSMDMIDSVLF